MTKTPINIFYAKKQYQKNKIDYFVLKAHTTENKKRQEFYRDRARYHARKFYVLDKMIKEQEQ